MKKYRDHFFLKAKQENYPARSVYKLKEIDKRFHIFRQGHKVLDLGAAPGSWLLGAAERVGENGLVIGADIQRAAISFPSNIRFYQEDVFDRSPEFEQILQDNAPFHVILSDMAPKTTGHRATDQARSAALYEEALEVALTYLAKGGAFVVKVFMGPDVKPFSDKMRECFTKVKAFKPTSSRSESFETFYVAQGFKGAPEPQPEASGQEPES